MRNRKAIIIIILVIVSALFLYLGIMHFRKPSVVIEITSNFYNEMKNENFPDALKLLYRKDNSPFDDDLIIDSYQRNKLSSFKINNIKKLDNKIYEVTVTAKLDDGEKTSTTNYVIEVNGINYLVLNKIDIPSDIYTFPDGEVPIILTPTK